MCTAARLPVLTAHTHAPALVPGAGAARASPEPGLHQKSRPWPLLISTRLQPSAFGLGGPAAASQQSAANSQHPPPTHTPPPPTPPHNHHHSSSSCVAVAVPQSFLPASTGYKGARGGLLGPGSWFVKATREERGDAQHRLVNQRPCPACCRFCVCWSGQWAHSIPPAAVPAAWWTATNEPPPSGH
jgi:hypothetical protein